MAKPIFQGKDAIVHAKVNDVIVLRAINYFAKESASLKIEATVFQKNTKLSKSDAVESITLILPSYSIVLTNKDECKIYPTGKADTYLLPVKMDQILLFRPNQK